MSDKITKDQIAAIAEQTAENIEVLKAYAAQDKKKGAPLVGIAITGLTGAKEMLEGHLKSLPVEAPAPATETTVPSAATEQPAPAP
jgi:hypothetical protein